MQTDPIGYGDGMNMYAYVGGDPVNWRDPSGMIGCDFTDALPGDLTACGSHHGGGGGGIPRIPGSSGAPNSPGQGGGCNSAFQSQDEDIACAAPNTQETLPMGEAVKAPPKIAVDKSCAKVPAAFDKGIQAKALEAHILAFSAQKRDPEGPRFREHGFTGRPYLLQAIFGHGFVTTKIKAGLDTSISLKRGPFDSFDVHTHYGETGPSPADRESTPKGFTRIVFGGDRTMRCFVGK